MVAIADGAGILHEPGVTVDGASAPLPALTRLRRGLVIDRPRENAMIDEQIGYLLGDTSGMLLPISTPAAMVAVLALCLVSPPRVGEAQLALVLAQHAAAIVTGQRAMPPAHRVPALRGQAPRIPDFQALGDIPLSPREQAVVCLVAAGLRNKEIAAHLGITEKTVKFHLTNVFEKIGAESRIEVVLWVLERDLAARRQEDRE
jgi:DNA-binding CsgD family transcriptional regulator